MSEQTSPGSPNHAGAGSWSAGAATTILPVENHRPMAGYVAREGVATGTRDELTVTALILDTGWHSVAILAADIIAVDAELVVEVAQAAGLDAGQLLVCASHTHSGPAGIVHRLHPAEPDRLDPNLRAAFVRCCVEALSRARARLVPCSVWLGQVKAPGVAGNRNDRDGPVDHRLSVLAVRQGEKIVAAAIHFSCHPTVLGAANLEYSADYPGAMRRALREDPALRNTPLLFLNGAAGDISTRFTRRSQDPSEVERMGHTLAQAAHEVLDDAQPLAPHLRSARVAFDATPKTLADLDILEQEAMRLAALAQAMRVDDAPPADQRQAQTRAEGAALEVLLARQGVIPRTITLQGVALGELALMGVPGELFTSLGLAIEDASPFTYTRIVGYCNGFIGYVCDPAAYSSSTYEALASPYAPAVGAQLLDAAAVLLRGLGATYTGST